MFYVKVGQAPFATMKAELERYGKSLEDKLKSYIFQYTVNCSTHFKILPKVHA